MLGFLARQARFSDKIFDRGMYVAKHEWHGHGVALAMALLRDESLIK
jgi:hypothetical protein